MHSRQTLDAILGGVADGITAQDQSGRLVFVNDAAARMNGFASAEEMLAASAEEILGRFELADEAGNVLPWSALPGRIALTTGQSVERTFAVRNRRTGERRYSVVTARPVLDPSGAPYMVVNVFRDVTERKRNLDNLRFLTEASQALASSLDFETTLRAVAALSVPVLADWCVVEMASSSNERLPLAVAHVDPAKVGLARYVREKWPALANEESAVVRVMASGEPELIAEISPSLIARASRDDEHHAALTQLGIRSAMVVALRANDRPVGVITFVATDESGRRFTPGDLELAVEVGRRASIAIENARLYRAAQEAIETRETFLSMASHELRTPLQTMLLSAELLEREAGSPGGVPPERVQARAQQLTRQAERLSGLVDRMLNVTRLTSGRLELEREALDLAALTREVVERHAELAAAAGCSIELRADGPIVGHWDAARLDEIVTNLLANAIKYGASQPITVTVAADGEHARLEVTDRGIGFDQGGEQRIFQRFARLVSDKKYGGFGLGLWISRALVEAHGGRVHASSPGPDRGASFTVELPRQPPPPATGAQV